MANTLNRKVWLFLSILLPMALVHKGAHTQNTSIANVSYEIQDNNIIVVDYDLLGVDKKYVVELVLKRRSLRAYSYTAKIVMGDVGKGKFAGINRKIIWSMDHETGDGFYLDPFVDDYYFIVQARRKYGSGWFWITILTGGAIWFVADNVAN